MANNIPVLKKCDKHCVIFKKNCYICKIDYPYKVNPNYAITIRNLSAGR